MFSGKSELWAGLFTGIHRILSLLRRLAKPLGMELHYIIEKVKMKPEEHDSVCSVLNGIPAMVQASRSCSSSRSRLFWTSFEITPLEGESLEKGDKTNVLHMKQTPSSTPGSFWDPKWDHTMTSSCRSRASQAGTKSSGHRTPQQLWGTTEVPTNQNSVGKRTTGPQASSCMRRETWPTRLTDLG